MPAWDISCGLYAALSVLTALRRREATGRGGHILLPLDDVALTAAANLGYLTEVMVNGVVRPRLGNAIFGQYGQDFISSDGVGFMVVALTGRHFRDLAELTGTAKAVAAVADACWQPISATRDSATSTARCSARCSVRGSASHGRRDHRSADREFGTVGRYQSFADVVNSPRVQDNPLFTPLDQPGIGTYLAPGLPMSVDGVHTSAAPAPVLGQDNDAVPAEWLCA